MNKAAGFLGIIFAFVLAMLAMSEVLTLQVTGEALSGDIGGFFDNVATIFVIMTVGVIGAGGLMYGAVRLLFD